MIFPEPKKNVDIKSEEWFYRVKYWNSPHPFTSSLTQLSQLPPGYLQTLHPFIYNPDFSPHPLLLHPSSTFIHNIQQTMLPWSLVNRMLSTFTPLQGRIHRELINESSHRKLFLWHKDVFSQIWVRIVCRGFLWKSVTEISTETQTMSHLWAWEGNAVCVWVCVMYTAWSSEIHQSCRLLIHIEYITLCSLSSRHASPTAHDSKRDLKATKVIVPVWVCASDPDQDYQLSHEAQRLMTWAVRFSVDRTRKSVTHGSVNRTELKQQRQREHRFFTIYKWTLIIQGRAQMLTISHAQLHINTAVQCVQTISPLIETHNNICILY